MKPIVIGIDPGGKSTGVVTRQARDVLYAATITRDNDMAAYIGEVIQTIFHAAHNTGGPDPVVAVEGLNAPTPHLGMTSVVGLIGAAQILGAVLYAYPQATIVPPGRHGSAPLRTYPVVLVGKREVRGTGKNRHVRSAYDIAGAALQQRPLTRSRLRTG